MLWERHPEADETLKRGIDGGYSYSLVAAQINAVVPGAKVTRNACIGRAHRIGIAIPRTNFGHPKFRKRDGKRIARKPRKQEAPRLDPQPNDLKALLRGVPFTPSPEPSIPENERKTLLQLEDGDCRWPLGDGPYTFCARPTHPGCSYCPDHARIAFRSAETQVRNQWLKERDAKFREEKRREGMRALLVLRLA